MSEQNEITSQEKYRLKNKDYYAKKSLEYYHKNKEKAVLKAKLWNEKNKEYKKTYQREQKRKRKDEAIIYLGAACHRCGLSFHPAVYEFHHVDPKTKVKDPSKMLNLSWERVKEELDKCLLLCANCHRLTHHEESYEI